MYIHITINGCMYVRPPVGKSCNFKDLPVFKSWVGSSQVGQCIRVDCWWHWYQYLKSEILWHKNHLIRRKSTLLWFVCAHRCLQTAIGYCGIAYPGHNSKSGLPVQAVFHFRYIIPFVHSPNVSNHCKKNWNKQYFTCYLNILLYIYWPDLITRVEAVTPVSAWMTVRAIPQDNRITHNNMEQ